MQSYFGYMLVMALITYAIRMLPLAAFQKEIKSPFIKSFLFYVPYAVLGAMTFPAIFTAGGNVIPSILGCMMALYLAYRGKGLVTVAVAACLVVYISDIILQMFI